MPNRLICQTCWNVQTETLQQHGMGARIKEADVFVVPKILFHAMPVQLMEKASPATRAAITREDEKNASMMV